MGLLDLLRRSPSATAGDPVAIAALLATAANADNPVKALTTLRREARRHTARLELGGDGHDELRRVVGGLFARDGQAHAADWPSCERVPWSTWDRPTNGAVAARAAASAAELLYLCADDRWAASDPVGELLALDLLGRDPDVALCSLGEANLFVRRGFAAAAATELDPAAEDVMADLEALARRRRLRTCSL